MSLFASKLEAALSRALPRYLHRGGKLLKVAKIGPEKWEELSKAKKSVYNQHVLLRDLEQPLGSVTFLKAQMIILDQTDKEFAFQRLNHHHFPAVTQIWINAPIHADVLYRFHPQHLRDLNTYLNGLYHSELAGNVPRKYSYYVTPKIVLGATHATAKERWAKNMDNVTVWPGVEGVDLMQMYLEHGIQEEEVITEEVTIKTKSYFKSEGQSNILLG